MNKKTTSRAWCFGGLVAGAVALSPAVAQPQHALLLEPTSLAGHASPASPLAPSRKSEAKGRQVGQVSGDQPQDLRSVPPTAWQTVQLGTIRLQVPGGWTVTRQQRGRAIELKSPEGRYTLSASWWFPDEPLLGYSDIKWVKQITVAGQPAKLIYSRFPNHQTLQLAFDRARADGRRFLIVLESRTEDFSGGSPLMSNILTRLRLTNPQRSDGQAPAKAGVPVIGDIPSQRRPRPETKNGKTSALPLANASKDPAIPVIGDPSVPGDRAPGSGATTPNPSQARGSDQVPAGYRTLTTQMYRFFYPLSWQLNSATRGTAQISALIAPNRKAMIVITAISAEPGRSLDILLKGYQTGFYNDDIETQSIEADVALTLGGLPGRSVTTHARIFRIEGVKLAFTHGQVQLFQAKAGKHAFLVAILKDPSLATKQNTELRAILASLRFAPALSPETGKSKLKSRL